MMGGATLLELLLVLACSSVNEQSGEPRWEEAIREGDFTAFKRIIESESNFRNWRSWDSSPMDVAVLHRNYRAVRLMEEHGLKMNIDQAAILGDRARAVAMLRERPWL